VIGNLTFTVERGMF